MIWHDVEQGSSDWFDLRKGIPTASRFDMILTPKTEKPSSSQKKLICELIGEIMSQIPPEGVENFTNRAVRWGLQCEQEARRYYTLERGLELKNGGFCQADDRRFGASPDSLIGEDGVLEIKCPQSDTQAEYLLDGELPSAYRCQVHGHLIVTGRKWCDFLSYSPGLPALLLRVEPDAFTAKLKEALEAFYGDFQKALKRIQGEEHLVIASWRGLLTDDLTLASLNANLPTLSQLDQATKAECWHLIKAFAERIGAEFDKDRREFLFALKEKPE